MITEEIIKNGYGYLDLPNSNHFETTLANTLEGWQAFCALEHYKKRIFSLDPPDVTDKDNGWIDRLHEKNPDTGKMGDPKQFFHFRPGAWFQEMVERAKTTNQNHLLPWFTECSELFRLCDQMHLLALANINEQQRLRHSLDEIVDISHKLSSVRFLCYEPVETGGERAGDHIDRSTITFHLTETHPGLSFEIANDRIPFQPEIGKPFLFPGKKATSTFASGTPLTKALKHGVHQVDALEERRYAVVFFGHSQPDPTSD